MVKKYVWGTPLKTEAVVEELPVSEEALKELSWEEDRFVYHMTEDTKVYGLGEANRGINKRGYRYVSFCSDEPSHTEEKEALYGAHNFLLIDGGGDLFGLFLDNPGRVVFDIGYEEKNLLTITPKYTDMALYVIHGQDIMDIIRQFRRIIGKSYLAPKWAFGFGQCRWSYENREKVDAVIRGYEENDMLLSMVYLDIDYMEQYKDFTVSEERFPDFENYVREIREKGIRLIPIIDAGVKIEKGYDLYEEGVRNQYFVKDAKGDDFVAAVWPGYTHFPDFLNPEARKWFGSHYKKLVDMGIEGFWNDMNEPAIFYSKNGVNQIKEKLKAAGTEPTDHFLMDELRWDFAGAHNRPEDYETMVHDMEGSKVGHDRVHNLYGYQMTRAAGEALTQMEPDKPMLLFSRASYIGMHRYGGIWMGDNCSWWSHILLNLKMLPSLNMCGFLYIGADTGGFGNNTTEDLVMRWTALSVFTPLFRNHSALGTRDQECYRFTDREGFKNMLDFRYRLLPYLYGVYEHAVKEDDMMYRPLAFVYPEDEIAVSIEDQIMLGEGLMLAPVYTQNAIGRMVYLPEDMTFVKMIKGGELVCEPMKKGTHFVKVALPEIGFFVRNQRQIPLLKASVVQDPKNRIPLMEVSMTFDAGDFEMIG